eukprot:Clim_evm19s195 gene=Clim_evmTU19s195
MLVQITKNLQETSVRAVSRAFSTSAVVCAGGKYRESKGISRSNTEYGPLVDTPDFSFFTRNNETGKIDFIQAPLTKRQQRRELERELQAVRAHLLVQRVDRAKSDKIKEPLKNPLQPHKGSHRLRRYF